MASIDFDRALSTILSEDDPLRVRFERWRRFLLREVTFSHSESVCHTTEHVERVLLFALLLGRELEVPSEDLDALALCAVFHDTRRHDDDLDVGHGDRAAAYYREYETERGRTPDDRVARIIARHDRRDEVSEEKFREEGADDETLLLYRILAAVTEDLTYPFRRLLGRQLGMELFHGLGPLAAEDATRAAFSDLSSAKISRYKVL